MSPPGRPKGEFRSAQHEGTLMSPPGRGAAGPIPVTVIGGYLGAGKTTLVNHLLRERDGRRIAVLVNDFGELSIDDDLIESVDGNVMRLAGGCVCCSVGNDLVDALTDMPLMEPRPDHILIEASGVALPGSVARTLRLLPALALDAVVVLADAETLRVRAADGFLGDTVLQQLRDADLLVLNKADLVAPATLDALQQWLAGVAPTVRVVVAEHARLSPAVVMGTGLAALHAATPREAAMLAGPTSNARALKASDVFESVSLEFSYPLDCVALGQALSASDLGLVRAKGLMRGLDGLPCALQVVGTRAAVTASAHPRPEEGRLVCIGLRGQLDRSAVEALVLRSRVNTPTLRQD
jgi:G3E family GTPase